MLREAFWDIIEAAKEDSQGNILVQVDLIKEQVVELSPDEICSFSRMFHSLYYQSYGMPLWDEVRRLAGSCSDDGFDYFRAWLIAQGEKVFSLVVAQPRKYLGEFFDLAVHECEPLLYVADQAYQQKTGREMPKTFLCPTCKEEVSVSEVVEHSALGEACQTCADEYSEMEEQQLLDHM